MAEKKDCRNCTERSVTCHATCKDYLERVEAQKRRYAEKARDRIYGEYTATRFRKCRTNPKKAIVEVWQREREAAK